MKQYSIEELEKIVNGFVDKTLDKSLWTHHAHIIAAIWHLMQYDKEDALCRMRSGIISYNLTTGGVNTGQNGYHETITVFWADIIDQFLRDHPGQTYEQACNRFLQSPMAGKDFPFEFYSREILLSPQARSRFVPADKKKVNVI
jgi:hypothetical protein